MTENSSNNQLGNKDSISSTVPSKVPSNLGSSPCSFSTSEPTQQHDMACYILKGNRSTEDDSSGKSSPASSEAGSEKDRRTAGELYDDIVADEQLEQPDANRMNEVDIALLQLEQLQSTSDVELSKADCTKAIVRTLDDMTPGVLEQQLAVQDTDQAAPSSTCGVAADAASDTADAAPSQCVFFARVPPTVPYELIHALFAQFGKVVNLNLFRPWASAKTSKGCGIVEYEDAACAVAAMEALHTKYHWTGGETTMVVEWMDPARHRQDRQHDDGSALSKAASSARNAKNNRKKNGRQEYSCMAPFNLSMALPSVVGRHMPPIRTSPLQALAAGVPAAGFSYGSPAGQQTSLMMGVGADGMCRRATYPGCISAGNQLGGAAGLTGCGSHLTIDGSVGHFDTTLLNTLGYNAANMHTAAIPAQWPFAQGVPAASYSSMTGTAPYIAAAASACQTWPLPSQALDAQLQGLGHLSAHVGVQDHTSPAAQHLAAQNMASMLLQRQQQQQPGWTALVPGAAGMHNDGSQGCFTGNDASLHQLLGNMGAPDGSLGGLGDINTGSGGHTTGISNPAHEAAVNAAANMQYLTHLQNRLEVMGTGSPASSYCSADCGGAPCQTYTPTPAQAAANSAAANWLMSSGGSHGAPLRPVATGRRSFAGDGLTSVTNSPMGTCTPTYFQPPLAQGGSNLNPGGVTPNMFNSSLMMTSNAGTPTMLAEQQLAGIAGCASAGSFSAGTPVTAGQMPGRVDPALLQLMYGGNTGNLVAADTHAWAGM